eukprot:3397287-Prymnesium_polylepis.1
MQVVGSAKAKIEAELPGWDVLKVCLEDFSAGATSSMYTRLCETVAVVGSAPLQWEHVLYFHCFSESAVWQDGKLTKLLKARSAALRREPAAKQLIRALLLATKGPWKNGLDPRAQYRKKLKAIVETRAGRPVPGGCVRGGRQTESRP